MLTRPLRAVAALAALASLAYASDPLSYHGGSILAMAGKDAAVLVLDKRIGAGNNLVGDECCRVLEAGPRSLLAVRGIQGDVQSLLEDVAARLRLRRLEEGDQAAREPKTLASLVSVMLYGQRAKGGAPGYAVEPVICGIDRDGAPYLCAQDGLGARMTSQTFVVAGTASQSLYGSCEALYRPDLATDELVEAACGAMSAGLDRDCLAGRDVSVHVVTCDGVRREDRRLGREAVEPAGAAPSGFR